jgi:magnesium chelatase family protein
VQVRERVVTARARALERQAKPNAELQGTDLDRHCAVDDAGRSLLSAAIQRLGLSARGLPRVLRLARTIADLNGVQALHPRHLAEALGLRRTLC